MEALGDLLHLTRALAWLGEHAGLFTFGGTQLNGMDMVFVAFMNQLDRPFRMLLSVGCYIGALVLGVRGCLRLAKYSTQGGSSKAMSSSGIAMQFVISAALMGLGTWQGNFNATLFGTDQVTKFSALAWPGATASLVARSNVVLGAVFQFVAVIGYLAVVRGLVILKSNAEGSSNAGNFSAIVHLIGGTIAANAPEFIKRVETMVGVTLINTT